ncbi:hypothetical protein [Psychroserpens luteolus]|uniref:hypothetical protein n=1 Tax=Psychroserpens luteolus TaxID=2855840 RepID=UPI001E46EB9A|nr:hypothetical protein [Psychroserpens luteolus]MCD2259585.1 hypothetical protein [Psychroserpens luteolus]
MTRKEIGFEINMKEDEKITFIEFSPEQKEYQRKLNEKNHRYYLTEFLGSEKNYKIAYRAFEQAMDKSLPNDRKSKCKYCLGETTDKGFKLCQKYIMQMQLTYVIASNEFISIVFQNRFIYNDKENLQKLTVNFFNCLKFIENEGKMYFDLDLISRYALNAGFLSLSQMFSRSETLTAYKIINESLDSLTEQGLQNKVLEKVDENYLELQTEFFESKLRYYKEKIFIEDRKNKLKSIKISNTENKVSIPQYALYYYYLQQSGDFGYFENHPEGKVKAIAELIRKESINTTTKYFQKEYNFIAHHRTNRVAKNKVSHIDFVANTMLKDFSKAKSIALLELKEAKTKNR